MNLQDLQNPPQFGQQMPQQSMEQPMEQPQDLQSLQGGGDPMQMMTMLAQNPTPETAQQVAQALQGLGNPDAAQFAQQLMQVADDPEALMQLADMAMQKLSSQ